MIQLFGGWVSQIHGLGWQSALSGATGKVWDCFKDPDIWLKEAKTLQVPRQTLHHKSQEHRCYSPFSGQLSPNKEPTTRV